MSPGVMGPLGVFPIGVPAGGVLRDILADAAKREFVADDVFVIVALPDGGTWGAPQFIDPACGEGFELAYDFRQAVRRSGRGRRGRFGTCPYGAGTRGGTGTRGGAGGRCCCRGGFRTRPYGTRPYGTRPYNTRAHRSRPYTPRTFGDNNDAMYVVGHDHKRIQLHIGYMIG